MCRSLHCHVHATHFRRHCATPVHAVKLDRDDNKVFVTAEAPFSKRYLKVRVSMSCLAVWR